jgi:KipI family sensor histidine kinase inhibitor
VNIRLSGDTMLLLEWEHTIDPTINRRVIALAERLRARLGRRVRDIVPAYCSVGIHFDPLTTDLGALQGIIESASQEDVRSTRLETRPVIEIGVRYGGEDGPDLHGLAEWAGCSPEEVIERHTSRTYRVYMLGFVPGFAYMGRVDERIAAPRRRVPRDRVAAGSVGIAGVQTGVYPIVTPGGWQLIGRTEAVMFDATRAQPSLLQPGDEVRFVALRFIP